MAEVGSELSVEVVYARPDIQEVIALKLPRGTTVRAAIERSRVAELFSEIDLAVNKVGVYGELRDLGDTVQDGDRIEIYRPLLIDPKEARRRNASGAAEAAQRIRK